MTTNMTPEQEQKLDAEYFAKKLRGILLSINGYLPHELAREFARLSRTACASVLQEAEFRAMDASEIERLKLKINVARDAIKAQYTQYKELNEAKKQVAMLRTFIGNQSYIPKSLADEADALLDNTKPSLESDIG